MAGSAARFKRAPTVVSYWTDDRLVFHNFATGVQIAADPLTTAVLHFFSDWRSADSLWRATPGVSRASVRQAVAKLARLSFLLRPGHRRAPFASWADWNPAAGFFHCSTKDVHYESEYGLAGEGVADAFGPMPPATRRRRRARRTALPPVMLGGEFVDVLRQRRTWRRFSRAPVTLDALSALLQLTFGLQHWLSIPSVGRVALKTSPSGGARHAIECYVWARNVAGLPRGLYHYAMDRHELARLRAAPRAPVTRYLPTQTWFNGAAAVVVMTAVFPRVQWRYRFPRAYRTVLAEAGHVCQTFCLTATWLDLAPFCSMALADSVIERDLGVDGVTESVLYVAGVGARPRDAQRHFPGDVRADLVDRRSVVVPGVPG